MSAKNKRIITVSVFVALIISNVAGGIIGFKKGFETRLHQEGLEAVFNVMLLNALRQGKVDSVIHSLETKLDWQIYNIAEYEQAHNSLYNMNIYPKAVDRKKSRNQSWQKLLPIGAITHTNQNMSLKNICPNQAMTFVIRLKTL